MSSLNVWLGLLGICIVLEFVSRTFNFAALAAGVIAAACSAYFGQEVVAQLLVLALVSAPLLYWLHHSRAGQKLESAAEELVNAESDDGDSVHIHAWRDNGTANVNFQGRDWEAVIAPGFTLAPGEYRIQSIHEAHLVLEPLAGF